MFTIQYSHSHTLPTAQWELPLNEETITPFGDKGWASALLLQSTQACPGLLGVGSDGWGVKDSQWVGRHKRHVLRDRKPVTVAAATMSCVYCVDIWRREGPLPRTRGSRPQVQPALDSIY